LFRDIVANLWNKHGKPHKFENWKDVFEEFEDTKGVIRKLISKKNRQHSGQKEKCKRTNNDLQNIHIQLQIE